LSTSNLGANAADWAHFSSVLGLTSDLLPVVSNPHAAISEKSTMKQLGKTPSLYYSGRQAGGIKDWTSKQATTGEVARWAKEPDYGICIQTRTLRALDIDVEDAALAETIQADIQGFLEWVGLPLRYRANSSKCLLPFKLLGDLPKRVIRLGDKGIIELLGTGQQFVAIGTHPSGARYEWLDETGMSGLPHSIPELTLETVDALWTHLATTYAEEGTSVTATLPSKAKVLHAAIENDTDAQFLLSHDWVKATERDGRLHITCPFEAEHTGPSAVSATTYFPANTGGYAQGHYQCLHAHCEHRTDDEFRHALGMPYEDPFDDFDVVQEPDAFTKREQPLKGEQPPKGEQPKRFPVVQVGTFADGAPPEWIIKGVIPKAELVVVYGESGSGKSFFVTDFACAVARGETWRGHRVAQGNVVYVAAEGAGGMRNRMRAYSVQHDVNLSGMGFGIIADAPNFMQVADIKDVIASIRTFGRASLVVVDTFAQVMAGSNENAGEDVGKALAHCRQIHKHTGATVVLIHHAGKDASKGARGWSGLRAAADAEIEVARCDDDRVATVTKMKDGMDGVEFNFRLETVTIAKDLDDDDITSCIVQPVEGGASRATIASRRAPRGAKEDVDERTALRVFANGIDLATGAFGYAALIEEVVAHMPPTEKGKCDQRRIKAVKAITALIDRGTLVNERGFLKLPGCAESPAEVTTRGLALV